MSQTPKPILAKIQGAKEKKLKKLDLSYGYRQDEERLTQIPAELVELTQLEVLNLSHNRLTTLPDTITQLQNLTSLNLSYNRLIALPATITRLQSLTVLNLSYNQLITLPDAITQLQNLTSLNLSFNRLTTLPVTITRLQNLRKLDLNHNNYLEIPPPEIISLDRYGYADIDRIKNYFRQLEVAGKDTLYEAKLLIVGEGGAGKTTLAKKIEDEAYQLCEDEVSTRGIEVIRWEFSFKPPLSPPAEGRTSTSPSSGGIEGEQKVFRVNIWDFGGQEIYHATHQFFLTKRSLYALVADTRKEDTDFYYWLNVVELLSDNSPLLIILNEKQDRHREINERQLRGQFTNLKETLAANLATNRGLSEIMSLMKHYLSHLPHIGTELPKTWVRVREALENDPRNHINFDEYLHICRQNGFERLKDSLQLSGYLHDLGVCLHFQGDPLLKKTVILKPEWGTAAVYKVLDDPMVIRNRGRFSRADLEMIWHEPTYVSMQDELLQLMINFKLCYQIPGSSDYIAPQLLTANQPNYTWPEANNLILRYTYDFMPKGILTQLIVAMQSLIADQGKVWKSGVILWKDRTAAEVIEYYGRREITVRTIGQHKKELLTIVIYELDRIHASYRRLKVNKLIPCNCTECKQAQEPYFYPFEVLRKFTEARQEQIQCQKSFQMVNVWGLIDDVLDKSKLLKEKELDDVWRETRSQREHLQNVISAKAHRLQILQEQQAKYGLETPPHIITEIMDIEAELELLKKELKDWQSNLSTNS